MIRSFLERILIILSIVCLLAAGAWAQTGTTSLRGTVVDTSGGAIVGAKVTLNNPASAFQREIATDGSGAYVFLSLPPATYALTVEKAGFRKYEQSNLQLLVNLPATANVTLEVGATTQTIEVSAQAVAINTTDASLGIAFNENQVRQLPLEGRNVPDLLSLQAGVTYTGLSPINNADTRTGAVNGARSDQSNITLDGVDVNDQTRGYAFTSVLPVTLDSVQEFRVTTTNSNADQGRSSGAQVSLVTKSGTNQVHGSLYEYHRNTITSANDYFLKLAQLQSDQPNKAPKLIRNIFGGSLGGPIKKDRFFFFLNYEGTRRREESSEVRVVPSASLRDGVLIYQCADLESCPGGTVLGHNVPTGYFGLSPTDIASMDPLGLGPDPVMLQYFNTFPQGNDFTSVGDNFNFVGYRFPGSIASDEDVYIARADYKITASGNHMLFWRGALENRADNSPPYLPGQVPLQSNVNFSKGFAVGYTGVLRPNLINNFRWGYTRQSIGVLGSNDTESFIRFRGLNDGTTTQTLAFTRSQSYQVPVHNFTDDVSWTKGNHTWQFGANIRFIRNPRVSFANSFSDAVTNSSGLDTAGMANSPSPFNPDPENNGFPSVNEAFNLAYDYPLIATLGMVTELNATYNFDRTGTAQPLGSPLTRRFAADEYEFYAQDSWKIKPNLTLTLGLRYSLFSPPWETNGTQVAPSFSLGNWFTQRGRNMLAGIPSNEDPVISFDLAGPANGKPGYYGWDKKNFGPRVALAWSPRPSWDFLKRVFGDGDKTTIRAGFGMVYDRIGAGLLNTFDRFGSFGLATNLTNSEILTADTAPRLTALNTIPTTDQNGNVVFPPAPEGGFPFVLPQGGTGLAIEWGLDDTIKTPYSYTLDFSVGRQLRGGMSLELSYVGRLSHRLLVQEDLAMPLDLVDPQSHVDYFTAARQFAVLASQGTPTDAVTSATIGPTGAYWQHMTQPLQPGGAYSLLCSGGSTTDPVQANYDLFACFNTNETTALYYLDVALGLPDANNPDVTYFPVGGPNSYFNKQVKSLYAWRSVGTAAYHALQVNFRKRMSHGLQFDMNYTFSKSMDIMSDAERITEWGGLGGQIINSWDPKARYGLSDFDLTHQINANWVFELPFGKGRSLGRNAHGALEAVIGGWQLSGLARWTSGFPVTVNNGGTWPTNWQIGGGAVQIGPVVTGTTKDAPGAQEGSVNIFHDPNGPTGADAFRHGYPGESGGRNQIRGEGFAGLDLGLSKRWKMPRFEGQSLQFRWEVFNVLNLNRFDVQSIDLNLGDSSFGNYTGLLTNPRVMQFALRYEF